MKQIRYLLAAFLLPLFALAQAPQAFSYQAIANNANGTPVVSSSVGVRISILDNTATGTVLYTETHTPTTNAQGLFNLNIGQGVATTGAFATINWAINPKFVKVELDAAGGTNYTTVGTSQLQSVPYALFAEKSKTTTAQTNSIQTGSMVVVYTATNAYGFTPNVSGSPTWYTQSLSGTVLGAVESDSMIVVYTTTNAYGFRRNVSGYPTWYTQSLSDNVQGAVAGAKQIVVYTNTNAYGFMPNVSNWPTWYTQSLSGNVMSAVAGVKQIVVYTNTNAYGFTPNVSNSPTWYTQSLSGSVLGATTTAKQTVVYTTTNAYGFMPNVSGYPTWYTQSLSGSVINIVPK
jgi:hypothetical protein